MTTIVEFEYTTYNDKGDPILHVTQYGGFNSAPRVGDFVTLLDVPTRRRVRNVEWVVGSRGCELARVTLGEVDHHG